MAGNNLTTQEKLNISVMIHVVVYMIRKPRQADPAQHLQFTLTQSFQQQNQI